MSIKEVGQAIRNDLSEKGYKSRDINVRTGYSGYSSTVDLTIKDLAIQRNEIVKLVNRYKVMSYDDQTGEILLGGNTYIRVEYDFNLVYEAIEAKLEEAKKIWEELQSLNAYETKIIVENKNYLVQAGSSKINGAPGIQTLDKNNNLKRIDYGHTFCNDPYNIAHFLVFFEAQNE